MKLIALSLTVTLAALLVSGCSKKLSDEQLQAKARTTIHGQCKKAGQALPNVSQEKLDRFCACSTERVVVTMGAAGLQKLAKDGEYTEEHARVAREASATCIAQIAKG
jgi:hypothetical protein